MRCLKCSSTNLFVILGNQNFQARFKAGKLNGIKKEEFDIAGDYPVICEKCHSEDIDFKYLELRTILNKIK